MKKEKPTMTEKISQNTIKKLLTTRYIGKNIFCYDTIDSTNTEAKRKLSSPDGSVFIAEHQQKGRGRLSRVWESEKSCGIYMSVLLKPQLSPDSVPEITPVTGLAVASALRKICNVPVLIKWPNDIVISGKKLCGILAELTIPEGEIPHVIVGIGINVNNHSFPDGISDIATSIFCETEKTFDRSEIVAAVLSEFERYYEIFLNYGFPALLKEYTELSATVNREVEIISPTGCYRAFATGIDPDGSLIISHNGKTEKVSSGEVSVRGIYRYV